MRSRTESGSTSPSRTRDLHGIDRHDLARGDVLRGLGFERLGLVLGLGEPRASDLLGPAAVGGEIDDDAVDETVGCDHVRHRGA